MRRIVTLTVVLALVTGLFTACGSGGTTTQGSTSSSSSADQQAQTSEASKEKVEISFIHGEVEAVEGGAAIAFKQALDKVRAEHPEITIKEEALGGQSNYNKVKMLAAANELPELFNIKGDLLDMLIQNNLIGEIGQDINADSEWKNQFLPGVFDTFIRDGKIYGVPRSCKGTSLVYYNEAILKDCGIKEFPKTWSEFTSAITSIKAKGYTPIALGNKEQWVAQSCILSTLADRITGSDWFNNIKDRKGAKFTDPEFLKVLQTLKGLATNGAFNSDMNSLDNMQQRTLYYNKKAAMFIEGAWAIGDMDKDCPKEVYDTTKIALLPSIEGGKGDPNAMSGGASSAYAMSNLSGAKKEAALTVLKALSSADFGTALTEYNKFPAVKPGKYDESKISNLAKQYNALAEKGSFVAVYDIKLAPALIDVINIGLQQLLIDEITPEVISKKIEAEYEKEAK